MSAADPVVVSDKAENHTRKLDVDDRRKDRCAVTTTPEQQAEQAAPRCPTCAPGEFGYRDVHRTMRYFCARHRLARFWTDARIPLPPDDTYQRIDRACVKSAGRNIPILPDGPPWDRPGPDVAHANTKLLGRPTDPHRWRLTPVAPIRALHIDAEGHLIHPCCWCGRDAFVGRGVNLRANKLGDWHCTDCEPLPPRRERSSK
jgi:hypothetical protein